MAAAYTEKSNVVLTGKEPFTLDVTGSAKFNTAIGVAYGGTGATSLTGYVKGSGTSAFTASSTIPGSDISGNISGNAANVTGTVAVANGGTGATTAAGALTNLGAAAASHTHGNITNAGAIGSTANLPVITTTSGVLTTGSFGTAANTFCQGNDSRLSNARTPTSHVLATASGLGGEHTVSGLTSGQVLKAKSATTAQFEAVAFSEVTGTASVSQGGTGATTLTGYVKGSGTSAFTASSTIPGSDISGNISGNAANVTGTVAVANGGTGATTAAGALTNLGAASSTHVHGNITNAGAIGSTANLPVITTTSGVLTTGSFGTAANTFCQGNDSRLSNARTPTAHVLATASGLGSEHTVSGLTAGNVLLATSATTAAFGALAAGQVSGFDAQVRLSRLDQMAAPTAAVSLNNQKITSLANPTADTDAATKAYVDAVKQGLDVKDSVRVATTGNITLSGTQTIDGVSVVAGNRVLVKDQSTASQNGIYVVAASTWSRADDANSNGDVTAGMFTFVTEGTTNADSGWILTTNDSITLGTTSLAFAQFSGAGQVTAGAGLTKTGNTLDVVGTTNRITVNADSVDIASTYTGQTSITTLGTVSTGTWSASTISVSKGGTGATTLTGYVKGSGTSAFTASSTIPGSDISGNISGNAANVTGTVAVANGGTGATTAAGALTNLGAASSTHVHGNITNAGAIGSTANLPVITTTSGVLTTGSFGTAANTFCQGNDSRLSNARTPTSHVLATASGLGGEHTVSGLTSGQVLKAKSATTAQFEAVAFSEVTGTASVSQGGTGATTAAGARTNLQVPYTFGTGGTSVVAWQAGTNTASGDYTVVAGGKNNTSSGNYGIVGGGRQNSCLSYMGTVSGGHSNTVNGSSCVVAGGANNTSSGGYSAVGGGFYNTSSGTYSTVSGGYKNTSSGNDSAVGGGRYNTASGTYATILGGANNTATHNNVFLLGSGLVSDAADTTYIQNLKINGGFNTGVSLGTNAFPTGKISIRSAIVNLKTVANTTIFTVPTGYMFLIDTMEVVTTSVTTAGTAPTVQFGNTGDSDAYYGPTQITSNAVGARHIVENPQDGVAAGTAVTFGVTVASTATAHSGVGIVTGYLLKTS